MLPAVPKKVCLNCNKILKGRIDKKFCDDACRNDYNNKQNSDANSTVRNINNALRKNRRILEELIAKTDATTAKVPKDKMLEMGFQFKYLTHTYKTQKGALYIYCYDYGYLPLENDWFFLVKSKD